MLRLLLLTAFLGGVSVMATDWPQWGGPDRNFTVKTGSLVDGWGEDGPNIKWKRELGPGHASLVGRDGVLYAAYNEKEEDVLVALDAQSGKTNWSYRYATRTLENHDLRFGRGPNATPLLLSDRLVNISFSGEMVCVDLKGKLLWSHDLTKDFKAALLNFGYCSSPIMYKGNIIVLIGGEKAGLAAFSPKDGSVVWQNGPYDISYASAKIVPGKTPQIVFFGADRIIGVKAEDGAFLWEHPVTNQYHNNATDPIVGPDNRLWVASQLDSGTRVLTFNEEGGAVTADQAWFNVKVKNHHWNAVLIDGHVYTSIGGRSALLSCIDFETGEIKWQERGFNKVNSLYADGKLIFLDHDGKLVMGKVTPEKWTKLAEHQLLEKVARTAPIMMGTTLYARDQKNIVAVSLGK